MTRTTSSLSSATCASAACASPPGAAGGRRAPQPIGERAQIAALLLELARLLDEPHEVGHALLAVRRRRQHGDQIAVVDDGLRARRRPQPIGDEPELAKARAEALEPL